MIWHGNWNCPKSSNESSTLLQMKVITLVITNSNFITNFRKKPYVVDDVACQVIIVTVYSIRK